MEATLQFDMNEEFHKQNLAKPELLKNNIKNEEVVLLTEVIVRSWMKIMERVTILINKRY